LKPFTDQMGHHIEVAWPPKRIISLVPSQTELLHYLGLDTEVVGITKFCVHPEEWFKTKTRVGGTKKFDFEKIAALQPDLIIGNKEENEEVQIRELMGKYPIWMSDIHDLDDAFEMMLSVGSITGKEANAQKLVQQVKKNFTTLGSFPARKAAYFIWKAPYMVAGGDTFLNNMLKRCNLTNVFADLDGRYPEVTADDIKAQSPDVILLSSEPFPFSDKHIDEFKHICPTAQILLVDGEYFSWYGSRLLDAPAYFMSILV